MIVQSVGPKKNFNLIIKVLVVACYQAETSLMFCIDCGIHCCTQLKIRRGARGGGGSSNCFQNWRGGGLAPYFLDKTSRGYTILGIINFWSRHVNKSLERENFCLDLNNYQQSKMLRPLIYIIKELVLKQCSQFYASRSNIAKLRG
jgi:hypothetical protein